MLHEMEVKRQLLECETLKNGEHVLFPISIDEVVRVLNSAGDPANGTRRAETQRLNERCDLVERQLREYSHDSAGFIAHNLGDVVLDRLRVCGEYFDSPRQPFDALVALRAIGLPAQGFL